MTVTALALGLRIPTRPPTAPIAGSAKHAASSRMASGWKMQSESMEMMISALQLTSAQLLLGIEIGDAAFRLAGLQAFQQDNY